MLPAVRVLAFVFPDSSRSRPAPSGRHESVVMHVDNVRPPAGVAFRSFIIAKATVAIAGADRQASAIDRRPIGT